jgi:hypothetical protein
MHILKIYYIEIVQMLIQIKLLTYDMCADYIPNKSNITKKNA